MAQPPESVGDRLRRARTAAGISQSALGKAVGVSRSAIAQCELGMTGSLTAENLIRAAIRMGKSPLWLATGEGPESDPGALGQAVGALPDKEQLAIFDFALYHMDKAGPLMGPKAAHYFALIERIKADLERKLAPAAPATPLRTTKAKT